MNRSLRTWFRPLGLLMALGMAVFAGVGPSALANDTPGNNGTVKIHEAASENDPGEVRNEPHVCTFHLHFYFSDPVQAGTWEIEEWAPTGEKGALAKEGTYDTKGDGVDREPDEGVYTLPDGHYKLFWDGDLDTDKHDKMKVFWVDCAEATPTGSELPTESATESPSESATESPSESPTESASESPSESPSESASESPTESASESPSESASESPSESASESPSESASTAPSGSELPIGGSGSPAPTGGVEGATGVPAAGKTPPPTDTDGAVPPANNGWRVILIGLAALITAAVMLVPTPATVRVRTGRGRRS
ncbi:MAG TPA: hypothetical protein VM408_05740 [Methylomirabilota bacterium]|nr:hypothetical protein [Methylomirabilota bacterium]